jgi:hypothetical protein
MRWLARWPPSTEPLSLLPLALVATVAVPTAIALHVVALSRLRTATRPSRTEPNTNPARLATRRRCSAATCIMWTARTVLADRGSPPALPRRRSSA